MSGVRSSEGQPLVVDELIELRGGDDRVLVSPRHGGRLASLQTGGVERLRTQRTREGEELDPIDWGCYLMAPWVGRLDQGHLPTPHGTFSMPATYGPHAIHGTTYDQPWSVQRTTSDRAVLETSLTDPWPLGGSVRQAIRLQAGRLDLLAEIRAGDRPMPAALGWHPWFRVSDEDETFVDLAAAATLAVREDLLPTGDREALNPVTRLTSDRALGNRRLDHTYVEPGNGAALRFPDLTSRLDWFGPVAAVTVHSPAGFLCIEPLTAWPNAPQLGAAGVVGTGLAQLEPYERLRAGFRLRWRRPA